ALYLRGRQKTAQVGMLRAMGAKNRVLRAVAVAEALVLWRMGTARGLALALGVAVVLGWHYRVSGAELRAVVGSGWWAVSVGGFLVGSLLGCVFGNLLATWRVYRRPAAESLGLTS